MPKAKKYFIFPCSLVLILAIGFFFYLSTAGKAKTPVRKKDNGLAISEAEWNRAVTSVRKKIVRPFLKDVRKRKKSKFTNPEFLKARIKDLLDKEGFDWGEESLNKYWGTLFGSAMKEEMASSSTSPSTSTASSSTASSSATSSMDKIILVDNGSFHFTFKARGDRGGTYTFQVDGSGLVIVAHRLLSTLLEKGIKPGKNSCDLYRIYPQVLKLHYMGNVNYARHVTWGNIDDFEETTTRSWSINRGVALPRPDPSYNANQIDAWRYTGQQLLHTHGCEAGFFVFKDYSPAGGPVKFFANFAGVFKGPYRVKKKGVQNHRPINYSRKGTLPIVFDFIYGGMRKYTASDFIYTIKECDNELNTPFSVEQLTLSRQGSDAYIPHYFKTQQGNPHSTVLSDHKVTVRYRYTLSIPGENQVVAIIENPPRNWRPKGGEESNTVSVRAYLKDPNKTGIFRFTLTDVSREKGIAMNKGDDRDFDYEFVYDLPAQSYFNPPVKTATGWYMETRHELNEATVPICAKDYGAWARLKAQVKVDGTWQDCQAADGKSYVTVPYDEDENHIADAWEEKMNVVGLPATWDGDDQPQEIKYHKGDGFTNYEEYRGFMVGYRWTSTDPRQMDIFIFDEIGYGVGFFKNTKLQIHLIDQDGYDSRRVVNFNRGYATLKSQDGQKGLHLMEKDLDEVIVSGEGGVLAGQVSMVGTPNVVDWVAINTGEVTSYEKRLDILSKEQNSLEEMEELYDHLKELYEANDFDSLLEAYDRYAGFGEESIKADKSESEGTKRDMADDIINKFLKPEIDDLKSRIEEEKAALERGVGFDVTIAHELGHAVNLRHHGDPFSEMELDDERGKAIAVQGGKWSGDLTCVMRYDHAEEYQGKDGKIHEYPPDYDEPLPTQFCTTKKGEGNPAGDATIGKCWNRITLKGRHYDGH